MSVAATVRPWVALAILALAALLLRAWDFGNPIIHVDEQYYLLVGARMWDGAVPYLDIWDRKPVGLFLLYALAAAMPGDGILAYQAMASLAAVATAFVVHRTALAIGARPWGAMAAALAYLVWLSLLGGRGGQAPVFYNLLPAVALWLLVDGANRKASPRRIVMAGLVACLACGVAIQIKYTAAVEGAFVGLAACWLLWRSGARAATLAAAIAAWALAGLAPTLAVAAAYRAIGPAAFDAFWFANFASIALRPGYPVDQLAMRLLGIAAQLSPLIACAALGWRRSRDAGPARLLVRGWLVAATVGFLSIGTFFDHYALPLIAPLAIAAATTLGQHPRAAIGALGLGVALVVAERAFVPNDGPAARRVAEIVAANSRGDCPYVFIGDTITYHLAGACLPTTHAFPNLLAYATEQGATGIDEAAEVRRILSRRPPVIVTSTRRLDIWNRGSIDALKSALGDYRLIHAAPRANWQTLIYLRRDLNDRSKCAKERISKAAPARCTT
jgi:hypothetical protein